MVKHFVDKGYSRGGTIRGAPFDWRYAPGKNNIELTNLYRPFL